MSFTSHFFFIKQIFKKLILNGVVLAFICKVSLSLHIETLFYGVTAHSDIVMPRHYSLIFRGVFFTIRLICL